MSQLSISSVAAIAVVLFLVYRFIVFPLFFSPLSKIPSAHFTTHVCPLWIYWIRYKNIENRTMYDLHKLKGPILRTAPSQLSVNCYEGGLKTIYTGGFHKTDFYHNRFINYGVDPMFAMSGAAHSARKRMLSHVYAKSYILSNPTVRATTKAVLYDRLLPIIHEAATSGATLEVLEILASYSMDAFMTFQFGLKLGSNFLHNEEERKWYLHTFYVRRPYLFWMTELPKFTSFMKRIGLPLVPKWVDQATLELEDWQMRICDNAEKLLSDGSDINVKDVPLVYKHERTAFIKQDGEKGPLNGQAYPRRLEIASDMYDHNAAAHETSGDTLCYLFYELSRRPDLQDKLREELRSLSPPLHYPSTPDDNGESLPDSKAVDQLPLLDAVLQETLRLWVAVPGGQPRVTPEPSCSLAGYDNIPPGVRVQSSGFAIHRDPNVFPEPNEWIPERWLNQTPEKLSEMRRWFWAWGSGGAMCIGSNIAIHSMKHCIAGVYSNYKTFVVHAPDMELAEGFTAGPQGGKLELRFQHVSE
ncbi:unnamed protein product [Clonostachys rosea]|uniref:Cytochrome P450 n=1 Tax=Bionectria ochroleuca TaxID=29856 RepID=A0ABY6UVH6_BIOOC|nr:unnamed protein product [Clonostachys rosea]